MKFSPLSFDSSTLMTQAMHSRPIHSSTFGRSFSPGMLRAWLITLTVVVGLTGCLPDTASTRPTRDPDRQAQRDAAAGNHDRAAIKYERLAAIASGIKRDAYLLDASRAWFHHGESIKGLTILRKVRGELPKNDPVIEMLLATGLLVDGEPRQALSTLTNIRPRVSQQYLPAYLDLRARALTQTGDAVGVINTLTEREAWLPGKSELNKNRRLLWLSLRSLARKGHPLETPDNASANVQGWLELARVYRDYRRNPVGMQQQLGLWRASYPRHIALNMKDLIAGPDDGKAHDYPTSVALLLPLSGSLSGPSIAIRDGFLAAYMNDVENDRRPVVTVYDIDVYETVNAYRQAVQNGAQFVVGPLSKTNVEELALSKATGVTTLALNYLPEEIPAPINFFQFSLAPEHESAEIARRALSEGLTRGVALIPASDWGKRLMDSFARTFASGGGVVVDFQEYDPAVKDFGMPITQLLNLNSSKSRHRAISAIVGENLEFEPRRRQDAQFVFLAANAEEGRLIRPQLDYHYANDLPVLSTSAIFDDDVMLNRKDLEGIIFADAPWMISTEPEIKETRDTLSQYWPNRMKRRSRLYAMGIDAYNLIPLIHAQTRPLEIAWPGMTGLLAMEGNNRISRTLEVAEIRNGEAIYLPPVSEILENTAVTLPDTTR